MHPSELLILFTKQCCRTGDYIQYRLGAQHLGAGSERIFVNPGNQDTHGRVGGDVAILSLVTTSCQNTRHGKRGQAAAGGASRVRGCWLVPAWSGSKCLLRLANPGQLLVPGPASRSDTATDSMEHTAHTLRWVWGKYFLLTSLPSSG